jgi:serine phosphatase RsbU (regulator of sigma subunit)
MLAADLVVVLSHFVLSLFSLPVTRFFNNISESYKDIVRVLRDRNHIIEKDLELAYTIQKSLLPSEYPKAERFKFASKYIPMDVIGGDFYDFIHINEHQTGILISDVSGHGVPAALITSMVKVAITSVNKNKISAPSKFLIDINKMLLDKTATNFITAFYGILDTKEMTFKFSNAGHCPPLYYSKENAKISKLETEGIVLGAFENIQCKEKVIDLNAGDKIILYTDGLTEAANDKRELYGFSGLKSFALANQTLPINAFIHCLFEDVKEWSNNRDFSDDIVIIGIDISK